MGANIKLETLSDVSRHDAHLRITCLGCGRTGAWDVNAVVAIFRHKRLNPCWTIAGSYFRCTQCGHRGAKLGLAPIERPREPRPLESVDQKKMRQRRERG